MGPSGLFYANSVGTFGVVSAGRNWYRLSSAAHRWAIKHVENSEFSLLLFPDDALVLEESEIFEESLIVVISPNDSGIPFSE